MNIYKFLFSFLIIGFLCGCGRESGKTDDATSKMVSMESYKANAEITYISDKSISKYSGIHYAQADGRYCIEIKEPKESLGDKVLYDGKMIWHFNNANKDKISVAVPDKPERLQVILFSFVKNMLNTPNAQISVQDEATILTAKMPNQHKYMQAEKLWINNITKLPEKLIIYDGDNKERVIVKFSDFKYNEEINPNVYTLQTEE